MPYTAVAAVVMVVVLRCRSLAEDHSVMADEGQESHFAASMEHLVVQEDHTEVRLVVQDHDSVAFAVVAVVGEDVAVIRERSGMVLVPDYEAVVALEVVH